MYGLSTHHRQKVKSKCIAQKLMKKQSKWKGSKHTQPRRDSTLLSGGRLPETASWLVFSGGSGNSGERAHSCRRGLRWSGMLRKVHTLSLELWGRLWRWWNSGGCSTAMWFAGDGFLVHNTGIENARGVWKLGELKWRLRIPRGCQGKQEEGLDWPGALFYRRWKMV